MIMPAIFLPDNVFYTHSNESFETAKDCNKYKFEAHKS